jgi:bifunctional non-homologous end joining protein LigD
MTEKTLKVGQRTLHVGNLDKILFPQESITEGDLIDYYSRIADTMLPHVQGRPVTMQRFPNGIDEEGFYQKEAPDYFPDWIERVSVMVEQEGKTQPQIVCEEAATLIYLADQACITSHIWLSRKDKLNHPDKLIFDLDPPDGDFEPVRFAARALHRLLEEIELPSYLMTTGSRGLHVVVPLDRDADYDAVRSFARNLSKVLAQREPDRLTAEVRKAKRDGRLFLDYLRNS